MKCRQVRRINSESLGVPLSEAVRAELSAHLAGCRTCATDADAVARLRGYLLSAPPHAVPEDLSVSLRILASRELSRRRIAAVAPPWWVGLRDRFQLWMDNLMRPIAIPIAGGLASALVLFSVLMPTIYPPAVSAYDVPVGWYREATVSELGPFGVPDDIIILDVTIDEQGRMVDYSIPANQPAMADAALRRVIENNLLFTRFNPTNFFGQPTSGKIRIALRRSQVDVRG